MPRTCWSSSLLWTFIWVSFSILNCRNPSLGLAIKERVCKGAGHEGSSGITSHAPGNVGECEGMNLHTPKWAPKFSNNDLRGLNSLNWRIPYIIGNILECKCCKWACMTHLSTYNTSYGQKKGQESNCQFDSQPLKVKNRPNFLVFRWSGTYRWKALNEGYSFALNLTSIEGLHTKLCASKVARVPISGNGSLGTKWHLGVGPVAKHREYYKGEGGGFPQV
jgi:hypothetical protein